MNNLLWMPNLLKAAVAFSGKENWEGGQKTMNQQKQLNNSNFVLFFDFPVLYRKIMRYIWRHYLFI